MSTNKQRGEDALNQLEKELKARERKSKRGPAVVSIVSALVVLVAVGAIAFFATRDSGDDTITAEEQPTEQTTAEDSTESQPLVAEPVPYDPISLERDEALPATVTCVYREDGTGEAAVPETEDVSTEGTVNVTMQTNHGDIGLELDRSVAPCTVNAIETLASEGYYDDTICHRVTGGTLNVLQCGDPTGNGTGGPGFTFDNEYPTDEASDEELNTPLTYPRGTIAMANAGINPDGTGTNGSQFFLNYEDSGLPPAYTYFGQIDNEGLAVLESIAENGTLEGTPDGTPAEEVRIETMTVN